MAKTNQGIRNRAALDAAVVKFQERVSGDPELDGYFDGIEIKRMLTRQLTLFALVAAGSAQYAPVAK